MSYSLVEELAQELGSSPDDVRRVLEDLREDIIAETRSGEQYVLEGLGTFRLDDGELTFEADQALDRYVNRRFDGLAPLAIPAPLAPVPHEEEREEAAPVESDEWTESLASGESDPLGQPDVYEDADFDVVDQVEAEVAAERASASDEGEPEPGGEAESGPLQTTPGAATDEPSSDERQLAPPPDDDFWYPRRPDPHFSVRARGPLPESAFVGATLFSPIHTDSTGEEPPRPVAPDAGEPSSMETERPDRPPARHEPERRSGRLTKPLVAGVMLLLLGAGIWLVAEQTDAIDQTTAQVPETEELVAADEGEPEPAPAEDEAVPIEPEPEPEPPAPDPIQRTPGTWTIVVASETSEAEARDELDALWPRFEQYGLPMDIIQSEIDGTTRYRVAVGSFDSQDEATDYLNSLSEQLPEGSWLLPFDEEA